MAQSPEPRKSERFRAPDSDITLQSSDAVLFEVHRKNLEMHSEGFAGADAISSSFENEVVPLSENSAVLELLLQYMYRQPQPDLQVVDFQTLAAVAEAAEKYQVYSATTVCNIYMRAAIEDHPNEVLSYAYKHNYIDIMNKAAPLTIGEPRTFVTFASTSAPTILLPWMNYQLFWLEALDAAHKSKKTHYIHRGQSGNKCSSDGYWQGLCVKVSENLGGDPGSLTRLRCVFEVLHGSIVTCATCEDELASWRARVQLLVDGIPTFSSLL